DTTAISFNLQVWAELTYTEEKFHRFERDGRWYVIVHREEVPEVDDNGMMLAREKQTVTTWPGPATTVVRYYLVERWDEDYNFMTGALGGRAAGTAGTDIHGQGEGPIPIDLTFSVSHRLLA